MVMVLLGVLLAGCGRIPADVTLQGAPGKESAGILTPAPMELVVLHTNDNWGETEPCG